MSTMAHQKGRRNTNTRSAAMPPATASPYYPQSPHDVDSQTYTQSSQLPVDISPHPTTPPQTPRRDGKPLNHSKPNSTAPQTGSKQKPRGKKPNKNTMTSPAVVRDGRNTSPFTGAQATAVPSSAKPISTPSSTAFAGPTFHASPAPSTLPIPSFYSKSVPDSPGVKSLKSLAAPSSSQSPTRPSGLAANHQFQREESPLDLFFKADREEKARARSASSTQNTVMASGPFQPPSASPSTTTQTSPAPASHTRPRHASRLSSGGMFAMELDGATSPGTPYGPAFSTPYSERITAARSSHSTPASAPSKQSPQTAQQTATSEALKAYLFAGHKSPPSTTPSASPCRVNGLESSGTPKGSTEHRSSSLLFYGSKGTGVPSTPPTANYRTPRELKVSGHPPRTSGRSSGLRQEVTPTKTPEGNSYQATFTTPSRMFASSPNANNVINTHSAASPIPGSLYGARPGNNTGDLRGMEENLRKILKLDSTPSSDASSPGIDAVPVATIPVPGYTGGGGPHH